MSVLSNQQVTDRTASHAAVVRDTVRRDELGPFYDRAFTQVLEVLSAQGHDPSGAAFGHYLGVPGETVTLEVGFEIPDPCTASGDVIPVELPAGKVAVASYFGAYDGLSQAWPEFAQWIVTQGQEPSENMLELYVTEPTGESDPSTLQTDLVWYLA
ncbi:GyrI-like domain-containing protein [Granulicoccus phenolivorans]|uniref:GyrI-like domain-containing protein n=1 Tax=Granulicoccus phenolivorans TaxID=266854 RepID=UPI0004280A54|nr:GyrI-like domain-containing protein [Granulicoccus phenolivorans]